METGMWGGKKINLQTCHGVPVWIGGCVVRDGLDDSSRVHVYRKKGLSELGVLVIDTIHVVHCADEGGDVDLIQV